MNELKTCAHCERELPHDRFWADSKTSDGRQSWCIDCHNVGKYTYEYRQANTIYAIRNRMTAEAYVGQTTQDPKRRFSEHLCRARTGKTGKLYDAMRVFNGRDYWELVILEQYPYGTLSKAERLEREQLHIDAMMPVFNTNNATRETT